MKCPKCGKDHTYNPDDPDASICHLEFAEHLCPKCGNEMRDWYNSKDELVVWSCDCGHEEKVKGGIECLKPARLSH